MKQFLLFAFLLSAIQATPQAPAGTAFFAEGNVHEIRLNFSQPGYWDSLKANYTLDVYMRCDVSVDGVAYPTSGVKFKGNSSYNNPSNKKPFRIDFAEYTSGQELDGMKKLVLNNAFKDPTFLREKLMFDFLNAHDIAAPRATFARLYLNNRYWGLYSVVEDVNKTFLKDRFDNKDGNLFKGDPRGLLTWKGTQQALYMGDYELKTNETENDWSDLVHLVDVLNNTPVAQLPDSLNRYFNLQSWFSYWAAHCLFVNLDSYIGSGHNYFIYHNTDNDKFEWITWDVNEAFGNFQMGITLANIKTLPYSFIPQPANQRPMMNRIWQDQNLREQYTHRLCELLDDFSNQKMDARIDELANLVRPHVYADTLKFYSNNIFEQNLAQDVSIPNVPGSNGIAGLKSFITARRSSLQTQLLSQGCTITETSEHIDNQLIKVYPNPTNAQITIESPSGLLQQIRIMNIEGRALFTQAIDHLPVLTVDLTPFPPGMYSVQIWTEGAMVNTRFLIAR